MKRILVAVMLVFGLLPGCAQNHFNVPTDNFAEKVKVLGVIPIVVDVDSDIRHPQKEQLVQILIDMNRKYEQQFVRKLKATGNYQTVALMDDDPQKIFGGLLFRREKRDDASIQYNKYFLKNEELREYIRKNSLDAVMLIVISGLTKNEKIYSSNLISSLFSDYNYLIMSAQIFDVNGTTLWEYPNFRQLVLSYDPMINLQYPDFSEAEANLSNVPNLKFKTLEGIKRSFDQKHKDLLLRETQEPEIFGKQYDEMLELLKYDSKANKKSSATTSAKPDASVQAKPVEQPIYPGANSQTVSPSAPTAAPPQQPPVQSVEPPKTPAVEAPKPPENVIVPATGSTL